jgi:hypothetical protein
MSSSGVMQGAGGDSRKGLLPAPMRGGWCRGALPGVGIPLAFPHTDCVALEAFLPEARAFLTERLARMAREYAR